MNYLTTLLILTLSMGLAFAEEEMDLKDKNVESGHVVTADNMRIYYDHYKNDHQKVIILAHGFFNSKQTVLFQDMAKALSDEYDVIVMDFRGHGMSDGPFHWTAKAYQDLEAILDYARQDYQNIGVIGFSLGAATSLITASRTDQIDSLIAVSTPTQFRKINYQIWRLGFFENIFYNMTREGRIGKGVKPGRLWLKKIKPIDIVDDINVPVLYLHGKKDWLVRPKHSEKLFEKSPQDKEIIFIEKGTHAEYLFRRDKEGTTKIFKEWFSKTL